MAKWVSAKYIGWALTMIASTGIFLQTSQAAFTKKMLSAAVADPLLTGARGRAVPDFKVLESMSFDEVCGVDSLGKTVCYKGRKDSTWIPDSISKLQLAFQNELFGCGIDEDNWKCWRMVSGWFDNYISEEVLRLFLESSRPETIQLSSTVVCAQNKQTMELVCLSPPWEKKPKAWRKSTTDGLSAIAVHENYVCWGDGNKIKCEEEYVRWQIPNGMELPKLNEIKIGESYLCARSDSDAVCWTRSRGSPVATKLSPEMVHAREWHATSEFLCAVTQAGAIVCIEPESGIVRDPTLVGNIIPSAYASPNPNLKSAWISTDKACALHNDGSVHCWDWWVGFASKMEFTEPVTALFGVTASACGLMQSGQVECRTNSYIDSRTLPKPSRVRVEFGGYDKCYWNEGGVDCRGRAYDFGFKSVKAVATSAVSEGICVIGVPNNASDWLETVSCYFDGTSAQTPPQELRYPSNVAVHERKACAISDEGVTCWGDALPGTAPPNASVGARKLRLSDSHGCVIDDFGFACWGDLANLQLEVPPGFEHPGRVVDFALGTSRTCVVLDTGEVECWGRDFDSSGPPPKFSNATSIVGRGSLFCALGSTGSGSGSGLHCWGGYTELPQ